jgi:hypothetical protein
MEENFDLKTKAQQYGFIMNLFHKEILLKIGEKSWSIFEKVVRTTIYKSRILSQ